jgi:N-acetylglucosaminyl-diphospho-decaprenol L-rhamnosyltransferase
MGYDGSKTTAVIVTYRSQDTIDHALDAAKACHDMGLLECIVVDNDSGDGTADYVRQNHPWVTVIEAGINLGFGRGCNVGLHHADTDYVLFLNPDAQIGVEALTRLHDFMAEHSKAGIISPMTELTGGGFQPIRELPNPWLLLQEAAGLRSSSERSIKVSPGMDCFETEWPCGAILHCRRDLMNRLGGFDPRFFLYFEETDLCVRTRKEGYQLWHVSDAVASHLGNHSADKSDEQLHHGCIARFYYESRFYYFAKHHGLFAAVVAELGEIGFMGLRAAIGLLKGRKPEWMAKRLSIPVLRKPGLADQPIIPLPTKLTSSQDPAGAQKSIQESTENADDAVLQTS